MKRLWALFLVMLVLLAGSPVYAEGVSVISEEGDKVSILEDAKITSRTSGDVVVILGNLDVEEDVTGDVVVLLGDLNINARVSGDTVNILGKMKLGENAEIGGDAVSIGSVERSAGAEILGEVVSIRGYNLDIGIEFVIMARVLSIILFSVLTLIFGLLIIVFSREKCEKALSDMTSETGRNIVLGFLGFLGATIILSILFITVIVPLLYFLVLLAAGAASGIYLGRMILRPAGYGRSLYLELFTGLVVITLVKVGLIYILPPHEFLLANVLILIFGVLINSLGIGILLNSRLTKRSPAL